MSFGRAIASGCAEQETKVLAIQLAVAVVVGAAGILLFRSLGYDTYEITRDDIEMLKDAAAAIGPGDPIARELWRLAERAEGK